MSKSTRRVLRRIFSTLVIYGLSAGAGLGAVSCLTYEETEGLELAELQNVEPENVDAPASGTEYVWYRGEQRMATRMGGVLVIEGDIEVGPSDIWGGPTENDEEYEGSLGIVRDELRIQGNNFKWPGGVVPFQFTSTNDSASSGTLTGALSAGDQTLVGNAMTLIQSLIPGVTFVPFVQATHANFISFNGSSVCSSAVGMQTGQQIIRLTTGCAGSFSAHHEILHALGIFHHHTRSDAVPNEITINWANIRGCTATATGPTAAQGCGSCTSANFVNCGCTADQWNRNTCNSFTNYVGGTNQANIGAYDFGSVMHYGAAAFAKAGTNAITVVRIDPATGLPYVVGQRTELSASDLVTLNTMYPISRPHTVFFSNTGAGDLCRLDGREADRVGTQFVTDGTLPSSKITAGRLNTDGLATGDYSVGCSATSTFWASNYSYPNTTVAFNSGAPTANKETFPKATATVRVLSRGLIPVLL